ncbi:DUF4347 domain-containing protein [Mesorhizobium sp. BH1-1-5]|uniref:DUF4347 domain-containing protein n=1 Tax=Mesorhizobium sp. BH1-1-5 TaxID=2876661 RepID=UPI001CCE0005|nr:DUF4347 domain-containing protein [Mesorhizobium sp. BH1-1-5]MBZ9991671.1 DUF4347 domain-containing protein [Mesorhizobium sp. BH1-1-5]
MNAVPDCFAVQGASEILFVDPAASDLGAILNHLRPEVGAIVLDGLRPAARQMAFALEGHSELNAVHVIAHGAPGRIGFAAGEWSSETLADEASDLAMIGRSINRQGTLQLWSCRAGGGPEGTDFIVSLSRAAGRPVAAASHDVGARARGGFWELNLRTEGAEAQPPLTEVGMGIYAGILIAEVMVTGTLPVGNMAGPITYYIVDTDQKAIVGQVMLPGAMPKATPVSMAVKVPDATASLAIGTFDGAGNFQRSSILSVDAPTKPAGSLGPSGR